MSNNSEQSQIVAQEPAAAAAETKAVGTKKPRAPRKPKTPEAVTAAVAAPIPVEKTIEKKGRRKLTEKDFEKIPEEWDRRKRVGGCTKVAATEFKRRKEAEGDAFLGPLREEALKRTQVRSQQFRVPGKPFKSSSAFSVFQSQYKDAYKSIAFKTKNKAPAAVVEATA
jgi:hypothetical protein